ncbi:hypothetical protein [Salinigranum marinum]|uniref:hypothetical protein n=1 Tax=Salinigranum marinum TaxID=1515595 RepID=UPI002989FB92|nr:hypothetical protein [Salinigranum marinum]
MNRWIHAEVDGLVDALFDAGWIDADTAARARELLEAGRPTSALDLVRAAALSVATAAA